MRYNLSDVELYNRKSMRPHDPRYEATYRPARARATTAHFTARTMAHWRLAVGVASVVALAFSVVGGLALQRIGRSSAASLAYYVSPTGSDSNPGTQAAPFRSIEHAASVAGPGTTVHVAPGTYTQEVYTDVSGTASAPITFVSDTRWGARLAPSAVDAHSGYSIWYNDGTYVNIVGFNIDGSNNTSIDWGLNTEVSDVTFRGNLVHNIGQANCAGGGAGISLEGGQPASTDMVIANVVHDVGPASYCSTVHGIYVANTHATVANNITYHNAGFGIHMYHAANHDVIVNNLSFDNYQGGIMVSAGDSVPAGVVNDYTVVASNIVLDNPTYGIQEWGATGTHNQYLNNLTYNNADGNFHLLNGNSSQGTVQAAPSAVFANWRSDGSGDYHLQAGSPAIGTATSTDAPSTDMDGVARPQPHGYDIGPYEYVSSTNTSGAATPTAASTQAAPSPAVTPSPTQVPAAPTSVPATPTQAPVPVSPAPTVTRALTPQPTAVSNSTPSVGTAPTSTPAARTTPTPAPSHHPANQPGQWSPSDQAKSWVSAVLKYLDWLLSRPPR